jgi:hypothetical protein
MYTELNKSKDIFILVILVFMLMNQISTLRNTEQIMFNSEIVILNSESIKRSIDIDESEAETIRYILKFIRKDK